MPATHYSMAELPAISAMKKGELQQELRDSGMSVPDKWSVPELRELVKELRGPRSKDPMSKFNSMNKAELQAECLKRDIAYDSKATKGWLLLRLRDEVTGEQDGHTIFEWGKHKGMLWSEVYLEKPAWTAWAKEKAATNPEASNDLQAFARWVQMVEAGGPMYKTLSGRHARDEGPDEQGETPSGSTSRGTAHPKATAPPPQRTTQLSPEETAATAMPKAKAAAKRGGPVDRMTGGPTEDAVRELALARARLAELEALHESWEMPGR